MDGWQQLLGWAGWIWEIVISGAVFLLAWSVFIAAGLAFRKRWRAAALWTILAIVAFAHYFLSIADALPMRNDGVRPLTVVTANLLASNPEYDDVLAWARAQDADVIAFEEALNGWPEELSALNREYVGRAEASGIRLYARYPLIVEDQMALLRQGIVGLQATMRAPGGDVTLIVAHLTSPQSPQHVDRRNSQLNILAGTARNTDGDVILLGDLNTSRTAPAFLRFLHDSRLDHPQVPFFFGTWPQNDYVQFAQIDHILVAGDLGYAEVSAEPLPGSDHMALRAEIVRLSR